MKLFIKEYWPYCIFACASVLHLFGAIIVDGYSLALLVMAFTPKLIPLIRKHFRRIQVGDVSMELAGDVNVGESLMVSETQNPKLEDDKTPQSPDQAKPQEVVKNEFAEEMERALSTLWHYQKQYHGSDKRAKSRWGMAPAENNYLLKAVLASMAIQGWVAKSEVGLYFLTDEGLDHCRENDFRLTSRGPHYTSFMPVQ